MATRLYWVDLNHTSIICGGARLKRHQTRSKPTCEHTAQSDRSVDREHCEIRHSVRKACLAGMDPRFYGKDSQGGCFWRSRARKTHFRTQEHDLVRRPKFGDTVVAPVGMCRRQLQFSSARAILGTIFLRNTTSNLICFSRLPGCEIRNPAREAILRDLPGCSRLTSNYWQR